jgi:MFS transporter, putative metabolite:H+ symporter
MSAAGEATDKRATGAWLAVTVAALGYFVDIYDLLLFSVVRVPSLKSIGVAEADLLDQGLFLLNMQMVGMLVGGILWGVLGDKRGRLSVLFGSIILYSLANIANGLVQTVDQYAALRLVAGIGLAGELGAGITLVSEVMDKKMRGVATTLVATVGICGALLAVLVSRLVEWRTAYFIGGGLGLALFALRVGVYESGMFERLRSRGGVARGNFFALFADGKRALRYVCVILTGIPIWYAVGILVTLSPEIGKAMGMEVAPKAANAVAWSYAGLAVGDFGSGMLSQLLKSRRGALTTFILLTGASVAFYFLVGKSSLTMFYVSCCVLGFATGYWAVFVTVAAEQFGTNLRATATTTVPNFVRGSVVPVTLSFQALKGSLGVIGSAVAVGAATVVIALVAVAGLEETYGKDLDYTE